mgnify:CR=1 FL=1
MIRFIPCHSSKDSLISRTSYNVPINFIRFFFTTEDLIKIIEHSECFLRTYTLLSLGDLI